MNLSTCETCISSTDLGIYHSADVVILSLQICLDVSPYRPFVFYMQ